MSLYRISIATLCLAGLLVRAPLVFADVNQTISCWDSDLKVACGFVQDDSDSYPACSFQGQNPIAFNSKDLVWFGLPDGKRLVVRYYEKNTPQFVCVHKD